MRPCPQLEAGQQAQHRLPHLVDRDAFIELSLAKLGAMRQRQRRQLIGRDRERARLRHAHRHRKCVVRTRREADQSGEFDLGKPALTPLPLKRIHRL